jgi:uncharacterized protein (TIGR02284 family)
MITKRLTVQTLKGLYQIAEAGEKGFATAAANMPSPALKVLFKIYAQQRLSFKNEIMGELRRFGTDTQPWMNLPGAVHRGRVGVYAGMSDSGSQERIILNEVVKGEKVAMRTYQKALALDLPAQTREIVERQHAEVNKAYEQILCLRNDPACRAALQLAASEQEVPKAVQTLVHSGFALDEVETVDLTDHVLYQGSGATRAETMLAGITGGALWGSVMGFLAGFGVLQTTSPAGTEAAILTWFLTTIAFMLMGVLISSMLAFFISISIIGGDRDQYSLIRQDAHFLVQPGSAAYPRGSSS